MEQTKPDKTQKTILWLARILGSLYLAFALFFLLAHMFGEEESMSGFQNTKEILTFMCFPVTVIVGLAIAYKWEGLGGFIAAAGMAGLYMLRPELISNYFMAIPLLPALLYITYWWLSKKMGLR
ncbi:MAG: hypothetical protein HKN92_03940 [Chitinophagales bacterium]|nr:hypothetical protein [Chitinophagales bacterium]